MDKFGSVMEIEAEGSMEGVFGLRPKMEDCIFG